MKLRGAKTQALRDRRCKAAPAVPRSRYRCDITRPKRSVRSGVLLILCVFVPALVDRIPGSFCSGPEVTSDKPRPAASGIFSCRPCHQDIYDAYLKTAHYNTLREADRTSIKGRFTPGQNVLKTGNENTYFVMEEKADGFYQTGYERKDLTVMAHSERFDLVIGSGRKGQSYFFWKGAFLFQLPVSYVTGADEWINSPGFVDGKIYFGRRIPLRCLECHATRFGLRGPIAQQEFADGYLPGISCEVCHGSGTRHVDYHTLNPAEKSPRYISSPAKFSRERKIDNCALCHSGPRDPRAMPFSYKPGEDLSRHLAPAPANENVQPDVHGNQVALLSRSRCFISSGDMSCSTCHNVHREERNIAELSQKCAQCHQAERCGIFSRAGHQIRNYCVDCHMPNQKSNAIRMTRGAGTLSIFYRSHRIAIYPQVSQDVLQRLRGTLR